MKIEFVKAAQIDGTHHKKGADADVEDRVAKKLIARGYAKVWHPKAVSEEAEDGSADC